MYDVTGTNTCTHDTQLTLGVKFPESLLGERPSDLQTLGHDRRCDEFVAGYFLQHLLIGCLVEQDQVVELVTDFSL